MAKQGSQMITKQIKKIFYAISSTHLMALLLFLMYPTLVSVERSRHKQLVTHPDIAILVAVNT